MSVVRGFGWAMVGASAVVAGCLGGTKPLDVQGGSLTGVPFGADCSLSNWVDLCTVDAAPNWSPSKAEVDLSVNPKDPLNVFVATKDLDRLASNCVWSVGQVTKDGGKTWTTVYVGGKQAERWGDPTHPLAPWDCVTDPILKFDASGVLYYPLQTYRLLSGDAGCPQSHANALLGNRLPGGCGYSFYLAVSTDGGATFPRERIIPMALGEGNLLVHDYPRMIVNPKTQTVSTVWNALGGLPTAGVPLPTSTAHANAYVVSTRDQGRSVEAPVVVSAPEAPLTTQFASGFAATNDGTVYMTVRGWGNAAGSRAVYLAVSHDDARSFGGFRKMFDYVPVPSPLPNTKFRAPTMIEVAADTTGGPFEGRLYAVWHDHRDGDANIYASHSADGGTTWSAPVRVNQDAGKHSQWMPRVDVGDDGTVHLVYLDRQWDPDDRLYDATHAWSTDGGLTWANQRVTSVSSDGDKGIHQTGAPFIGDYIGIDALGEHVYTGFPSTAGGVADLAVAHLRKSAG